jgi:hypothetical protein
MKEEELEEWCSIEVIGEREYKGYILGDGDELKVKGMCDRYV